MYMVNIRPFRLRSVSDARAGFNSLIADLENGVITHIAKGSRIVGHLVPTRAKVIDDPRLMEAMITALCEREASTTAAKARRGGRFDDAGTTVAGLLAWAWRTDEALLATVFGTYHHALVRACGRPIRRAECFEIVATALRERFDEGEILDVQRYLGIDTRRPALSGAR
ncbi:hypothetical protein B7435_30410 [Mycolicibacterium peregrinum]|nr:hypothetical protein B7435_30410 [Mycolicibacterium peregrinum]